MKSNFSQKLVPIILCGGSGTRLWPLSRKNYPKQFLPLLSDNTMLQETILRLKKIPDIENPIIISNDEHRFLVAEQCKNIGLNDPEIILEPISKNTAPAIVAGALHAKLKFDNFSLEHSDRWMGRKDLMPDREFVDTYYQHQQQVLIDSNYNTKMQPICLVNDEPSNDLYIDAEGDFYPCCWLGTYSYKFKSVFSPKDQKFNIQNNTLDGILGNSAVKEFFNSTKQFTSAHNCCKIKCGVKNG